MAEARAPRESALEGFLIPADIGAIGGDGPGLTVTERRALAIVQVDAWAPSVAETAEAIGKAVGVTPSLTPLTATVSGDTTALWLGPERWQITEPEAARRMMSLFDALSAQLEGQAVLTDQGHGRICLRLRGPAVRSVLAKGCTLDLDPGGDLDPGRVANTALGHMAVTLHRLDAETVDLYAARSFALSIAGWVTHAAAEYGCRVMPAA